LSDLSIGIGKSTNLWWLKLETKQSKKKKNFWNCHDCIFIFLVSPFVPFLFSRSEPKNQFGNTPTIGESINLSFNKTFRRLPLVNI